MRGCVYCLFVGRRAHFFALILLPISVLILLLIPLLFPLPLSSWVKGRAALFVGSLFLWCLLSPFFTQGLPALVLVQGCLLSKFASGLRVGLEVD